MAFIDVKVIVLSFVKTVLYFHVLDLYCNFTNFNFSRAVFSVPRTLQRSGLDPSLN